jgi:membrane-bound lytic murein transglycosylase D
MCVERAVERTGYADFWELRRLNVIPKETTNYVPIVQALAIISLNPAAYGIELPEMDPPLRFDTHTLDAKTNLNLVADLLGITKAEVRELNPAVKGDLAPQGYPLRVPKQTVPALLAGLNQVPAEKRIAWRAHRVSDGDTLPAIAKQFKVTPAKIAEANALTDGASAEANALSGAMRTGDLLLIPATYTAPVVKRAARKSTRKAATRKRTTTQKATPAKKTAAAKKSASAKKPVSASKKPSNGKVQTTARKSGKAATPPRAANAGKAKVGTSRG